MTAIDTTLLDAMDDIVILTDSHDRCLFANAAFLSAFGGSQETWRGVAADPCSLPRDDNAPAGERSCDTRFRLTHKSGDDALVIEWRVSLLEDGQSLFCGRPVEAAAHQNASERHPTRMLATMSHEMRTPLNGILGMTSLLVESGLDANQTVYAEAVRQSGTTLLTLINDILDYSKIEAGHIEIDAAPFDPRALVQSVAELLSPRAGENGLDIAAYVDPSVPASIIGDEARLRQVLLNLAGNAIKFTESGGVAIEMRATATTGDALDRITLDVIDTGIGIADDEIEGVFDEFSQTGSSHGKEGTGLGLAIVRRIVRAMGGDITARSTPGEGSKFSVSVPVRAAGDTGRQPASMIETPVIVLTDSLILGRVLKFQMEAARVRRSCITANPAKAAALLQRAPDATLLCDYPMARRHGKALAARCDNAIVMLESGARGALAALRQAGFDGYLVKPIRPKSLVERLRDDPALARTMNDEETQEARPAPPANDRRYRILLAEDNKINAVLATTILTNAGHEVDQVLNGHEALAALDQTSYDLVLMDMHMPGMDGLTATRKIRALEGATARLPIIALTANAMRADRERCLEAGMDDFLSKPFNPEDLRSQVARWGAARHRANGTVADKDTAQHAAAHP